MDLLPFLAQFRTEWDVILPVVGRFLVVSLFLYFAAQALMNIPMLQRFLVQPPGQLGLFIVMLAASGLLCFWLVPLRVLHAIGVVALPTEHVWPDIILSALALSRMAHVWHYLFRWLDRRSAT